MVNIATKYPVLSAEQYSHILFSERNEAIIVKKNTATSGVTRNRHSFSVSGGVSYRQIPETTPAIMPIAADAMMKVSVLLSTVTNNRRDIRNNQLRDFFSSCSIHTLSLLPRMYTITLRMRAMKITRNTLAAYGISGAPAFRPVVTMQCVR